MNTFFRLTFDEVTSGNLTASFSASLDDYGEDTVASLIGHLLAHLAIRGYCYDPEKVLASLLCEPEMQDSDLLRKLNKVVRDHRTT